MNVSFYGRVSTGRQENEQTIETQIMAIRDFCKQNGHTIIKEYRDEGWSGTILARPALDELRIDATKQIWEAVVVYDPDRLARKYSYQELIIDELTEKNVPVLFVTTLPPKDDGDKLLYGVKGLFAEYERARIAERFRLGKLRKAREGNVVTSQAPYGYRYIPKLSDKQGFYEVVESEAAVVQMIFDLVGSQKLTIRKIIKELQRLGIKSRKSKRGVWNTSTLSTLLRNETYIGKAYYNRSTAVMPKTPISTEKYKRVKKSSRTIKPKEEWIPIPCLKIIDEDLFFRAQKQLKINFELCERNKKNEYLLADLIRCICGSTRAGEGPQKGKHLYYRCTSRVKSYPQPTKCEGRGLNARIADKLVWDKVRGLMSSPQLIEGFKQERQRVQFSMPQFQDLESFCKKAVEMLKSLDFDHKRAIIRELVDKIVATQQEVAVYGYLPIVKEENVNFWSECRHLNYTVPLFQFTFSFQLPRPRKDRLIVLRNELGRILKAETPKPLFAIPGRGTP